MLKRSKNEEVEQEKKDEGYYEKDGKTCRTEFDGKELGWDIGGLAFITIGMSLTKFGLLGGLIGGGLFLLWEFDFTPTKEVCETS